MTLGHTLSFPEYLVFYSFLAYFSALNNLRHPSTHEISPGLHQYFQIHFTLKIRQTKPKNDLVILSLSKDLSLDPRPLPSVFRHLRLNSFTISLDFY